jgi:hypothetical protein
MTIDLEKIAKQYKGSKLAELILAHAKLGISQNQQAFIGLKEELPAELQEPVSELIDFFVSASKEDNKTLFSSDLQNQFRNILNIIKGFLDKNYRLRVSEDDTFKIFNLLCLNWALNCNVSSQNKAAMQKAAGIGLIARMFSR